MIHQVFSVFDNKAEFFMPPFMTVHRAQAVRLMMDECSRAESLLARHPADFTLYRIATWDDQNGRYELLSNFEFVGVGNMFLPAKSGDAS
jgi:hypothetical protein